MADTYTALLRLAMQANLQNINQWGTIYNAAVLDLIDDALCRTLDVDMTLGNVMLQTLNGSPDTARPMMLQAIGSPGGTTTITVPTLSKFYIIVNATAPAHPVNIKTALSNTRQILPSQTPAIVFVDATNNVVRSIGRANGIVPMTAWVDFPVTFANRTAGDLGITIRYAIQGNFVTLYIPVFNVTVSSGFGFNELPPAIIVPDNQITFPPAHISGLGAGAVAAFFFNTLPGWGFTSVGIAAFGAGPFISRGNLTYVYSLKAV